MAKEYVVRPESMERITNFERNAENETGRHCLLTKNRKSNILKGNKTLRNNAMAPLFWSGRGAKPEREDERCASI